MARTKAPKHFFEPWVAAVDSTWDIPYQGGPPKFPGDPDEVADKVSQWEAAKDRAKRNASWLLWGSGLAEPSVTTGLFGNPLYHDGRGIVAHVRNLGLVPDGSPDMEGLAKRIATCVSACAGIVDPVGFVSEVRALLLSMSLGETDRGDVRVTSLLYRCIPAAERKGEDPCEFD